MRNCWWAFHYFIKTLLDVTADVSFQVLSQLSFCARADVLDGGGQGAPCSFFSMMRQTCQPSPLYDHSQLHDRQAASSRLCCCCAAVIYAHHVCVSLLCIPKLCSCFTLELRAVHASSHKNLQQFYCFVVPPVVAHLKKTQAKGNAAGATSGASSGQPASLPLLCCCSCATLIMYVCLCFVFPSCAVSSWSWELCMHLPTKIYSSSTATTVLLLCGPTCSSPLKKNAS